MVLLHAYISFSTAVKCF